MKVQRQMQWSLPILAFVISIGGCASVKNTPAQDRVWNAYQVCRTETGSNAVVQRVDPDGRYYALCSDVCFRWSEFQSCLSERVRAQRGNGAWQQSPRIMVIGVDSDPRQPLIDEAVAFWNRTLEELGSGFRLRPVERISLPIPERALQALSQSIVGGARPVDVPQALRDLPGDLTILLADSDFISFAGPFHAPGKRLSASRVPTTHR